MTESRKHTFLTYVFLLLKLHVENMKQCNLNRNIKILQPNQQIEKESFMR